MKILTYISASVLLLTLAAGCSKGIDPISPVDPGPDGAAPAVTITYPTEGYKLRVPDAVAPITIKLEATDDIELKKVSVQFDGTDVSSYTTFIDYRRAMISCTYPSVADGDHTITVTATDMTDKTTTTTVNFKKVAPYNPLSGEVFYMPFDGDYNDLVSFNPAVVAGAPGFAAGKVGQAYAGATDGYLTFPTAGLLGTEFSATFWYKLNAVPTRAGIFTICRPYITYNDTTRFKGLRIARENSGANQNLFLNFGTGDAEVWMNPFYQTASDAWIHIAVSISANKATVYVNGAVVKEAIPTGPISWTGCNVMSIGSGMPNFSYWEHFSDLSQIDELRVFNKALTAEEVNSIYTAK
jgi:hypothetical protein